MSILETIILVVYGAVIAFIVIASIVLGIKRLSSSKDKNISNRNN